MVKLKIVRWHRSDSWTRALLGEVIYSKNDEPYVDVAGTAYDILEATPVYGYDVSMEMFTPMQMMKLHSFLEDVAKRTGSPIPAMGELFVPSECVEVMPDERS